MIKLTGALCAAFLFSGGALAAPDIVRLTPEQAEQAINSASARKHDPAMLDGAGSRKPQVHGEVGMMIGTGGARGLYGAADVPIGDNGGASIAVASEQYGRARR